ncbi:hypothetical protein B5X24_HaOG204450 [Helicoverpa armigera]|uniref:Uncharacterized protein n=1 Tax=Helicoverpa armigera TaxID=29058 RepID=A0A2W1BQG8_HELAM|nr:hypothetical protein B5X24_HaOG204450 [Helicoverpa armigera]
MLNISLDFDRPIYARTVARAVDSALTGHMNSKALCAARLTSCGKLRSRKAHLPNWVNIAAEQSAQFIDNLPPDHAPRYSALNNIIMYREKNTYNIHFKPVVKVH